MLVAAEGDLNGGQQVVGSEGLHDVGEGSSLGRTLDEVLLAESGEKDHRSDLRLAELLRSRDSVELRHLHVHDDEIRSQLGREGDCGFAVAGLSYHLESVVSEDLDDVESNQRFVLSDDNTTGCVCGGILLSHPRILR